MPRQGLGHDLYVPGHDDIVLLLGPDQDVGVQAGKPRGAVLAYAGDLDGKRALTIGQDHCRPEWAAKILVDQISKRHDSDPIGVDRHRLLARFESRSHLCQAGGVPPGRLEMVELSSVLRDIRIHRLSIFQVENNHLMNHDELQCWKLAEEHLGVVPLIVIMDEVVQPDSMAHHSDLSVGAPVQAVGQPLDERFGTFHLAGALDSWVRGIAHSIGSSSFCSPAILRSLSTPRDSIWRTRSLVIPSSRPSCSRVRSAAPPRPNRLVMISRSRSSSRSSMPLMASCMRLRALSYSCSSVRLSAAASNISSWPVTKRSRR